MYILYICNVYICVYIFYTYIKYIYQGKMDYEKLLKNATS